MYIEEKQNDEIQNSIYYIFFKSNSQPFPYVTTREYDMTLNVFNIVSSIYNKHKPKRRQSFLNYPFVFNESEQVYLLIYFT